ncbi:hypothetical protein M0R45_001529 [Rubus argutus]|uniref:Uncharacterized protein n=1 Tax=Rubus argutus TaxID=59490 RepID=A0AAW1VLL6_RUBAR
MRTLKRKQYRSWDGCRREEALAAGVAKYGLSNWKAILQIPPLAPCLTRKSCEDLMNKWRNLTSRVSDQKTNDYVSQEKKRGAYNWKRLDNGRGRSPSAGVLKHGMRQVEAHPEDPEFRPALSIAHVISAEAVEEEGNRNGRHIIDHYNPAEAAKDLHDVHNW